MGIGYSIKRVEEKSIMRNAQKIGINFRSIFELSLERYRKPYPPLSPFLFFNDSSGFQGDRGDRGVKKANDFVKKGG